MNNKQEFIKDLKALLEKNNVYITFEVGESSDTHGLYNERLELCNGETNKPFLRVEGWVLTHSDLQG